MSNSLKRYALTGRLRRKARRFLGVDVEDEFSNLRRALVELDDVDELKKLFRWSDDPILNDPSIHEFVSMEDLNCRRIRAAECIGTIVRNVGSSLCLDIVTGGGHAAA